MALAVSILFITFVVTMASLTLSFLEKEYREELARHQFALASSLANNIDDKLRLVQSALLAAATKVPPDALHNADRAQQFLNGRVTLRAIFGDASPAEALSAYVDLDEYALLHQAARWARGESVDERPTDGDGRVQPAVAEAWRAILLRQPSWRAEAEVRVEYEAGEQPEAEIASLGPAEPGVVAIDLAVVDARPADATATDSLLAVEGRDGSSLSLARSLGRLPAYALIARRYRRLARG
jgi:hypothetical protein